MGRSLKSRFFSGLMALMMVISLVPAAALAEGTATYSKITTIDELTTGKYVMVASTGYAPGVLDGSWISAVQPTISGDQITNASAWTITAKDGGVTLADSNGTAVAPKAEDKNGIIAGDFVWTVKCAEGAFTFSSTGTVFASNSSPDGANRFRAYKKNTVAGNPAGYPTQFTLYKVAGGGGETPTPDPQPTAVSIADALAGDKGTSFTVKGVVTLVDGQNIYLQDDTGAICARLSAFSKEIALGDTLVATGSRTEYNGTPQLGNATFVKSSGLSLSPKKVTIGALTPADICSYVKLSGLEITEIFDNNGQYKTPTVTVTDGTDTIQLYKAAMSKNADGQYAFKVGDKIDVTAAVGYFVKGDSAKFQLRTSSESQITLAGGSTTGDPITDDMIPQGVLTVKQANAADATGVSVIGQVVYHYGNPFKGGPSINSIILEDIIDGEIYGFQIFDFNNYADYKVGDVVKVTGDITTYNGVKQMKTPQMTVVKAGLDPIPAQKITASQMGPDYLSEYVYIQNVTLGTYDEKGATPVTDATGSTKLFKGAPLPAGATVEEVVAVYGCCSAFKNNYQLRNGTSADYVLKDAPATGGLPAAGDKVTIYNLSSKGVLSRQNDNAESPSILNAAVTLDKKQITEGNGGVIFTVEKNGEYFRFHNETYGYLCSKGTGNNAFYSTTASDDADWKLNPGKKGGFQMESRTAKFNGRYSQFLEYFSESYKTYSMNKVTDYDIFEFFFYGVSNGLNVNGGIINTPTVTFGTLDDAFVGSDYTFRFTVDAVFGIKNLTVTVNGKTITANEDGSYTVPAAQVTGETLSIQVSGTDTKGVAISGTANVTVKDEPVIGEVTPASNSQTLDEKRPVISAVVSNAGKDAVVTMTINNEQVSAVYDGAKVSYTPASDMADGKVTVTVSAKRADGKEATKTWSFTVGKSKYQHYFGQLHSHTTYSDGSGSLESALEYVKNLPDSANVDFVAFTDHSNYFDSKTDANPEDALYNMSLATAESQKLWKKYKDTVDAFNNSQSDILALGGFEMTWSGGPGHINTFNTPGIVSRNNTTLNNKTSDAGMKSYYALLSKPEGIDSISQFNHPGNTFGTFSDFAYWDPVIDSRIHMVEVGNGEGQIGAGGYYPSYEYYTMALDKGWHVVPTNNQDNHKGKWGNANDARDVIITDDFTEQGLYDAIRNYRVYSTEDKNLTLNYTVNGLMMGSSIPEENKPEKLNINVSVFDPDPSDSISKVEVIVNSGKVAYTWHDPAVLETGELSCELPCDYSYYYIRVTQGDGNLAVTAPVWVGESLKLGISALTCGTDIPVTNEELSLSTTFFNSETTPATIKSMTYAVKGGEVLATDNEAKTIPSSGTLDVPFKLTPKTARVTTITVTAVVELDGKEYTFTKNITLDVQDSESLVYLGIDAAHYNEYVSGNYKDSMGNFTQLAAKYNVRTVMLNTSDELIAACNNPKYKAMILTAPSRRLEAAQKELLTYTNGELDAIKSFNQRGGVVILAGWSDHYEDYPEAFPGGIPADKHMAATQNAVLKALGSSLRVNDDATYDDVRGAADGVDPWRLYFNTYGDSFLTDRIEVDSEHPYDRLYTEVFSHYGGASISTVDGKLPGTVSPIVFGHTSTYSKDTDRDGLGGDTVPKYEYAPGDERLMIMASEQLEGQGLIVVSGAAFMSNFEVQAKIEDNGSEKNYANYKVCENLLNYINPVTITPIAEVQKQPEEGFKYTIEGIVTSNASGYDKNTAFFDCIYLQDETGGINAFPVAGNYKIGDKLRITGTTSSYQGERQIAVTAVEKIGEGTPITPADVTAQQINDGSVLGQLARLKGTVVKFDVVNGLVQTIIVKDKAGNEARIFIDGYITTDKDVQNLEVGCDIEAVGCVSYDNSFDGTPARLRIRNRADILCTEASVDPVDPSVPGESTPTDPETPNPTGPSVPGKDPTNPVTPGNPSGGNGSATTGDSTNLTLIISVLVISAVGLAVVVIVLIKKRKSN